MTDRGLAIALTPGDAREADVATHGWGRAHECPRSVQLGGDLVLFEAFVTGGEAQPRTLVRRRKPHHHPEGLHRIEHAVRFEKHVRDRVEGLELLSGKDERDVE